ncbi:iron ABC transporter permease [Jonesiaceae bacterium BS-20]|uniref:Iron ABC transporter permease n=1 Tax=Jonesiaceae bacterium BS-20 TaxID=3120821 RepID=A0AAU7DUF1_9MICO
MGKGPAGWRRAVAWSTLAAVPVIFLVFFFAWPVTALVGRGFIADGALDLTGFWEVLSTPRTWRLVGITLGQGLVGTVVSLLLGIPGAFVLYRCTFRGRTFARALITVPFVLPTVVVGVAFRALLASSGPLGFLGLDGTFTAIVLALVFFNYSVVVRTVGGLWQQLDPRVEQAARALGASPLRALFTVTLPALTPAILSAAAVVFLFCSTAFGTVMVLGGQGYGTIETEIWMQTVQFLDLRTAAVLSILQLLIVGAALTVSSWARTKRETALHLQSATTSVNPLKLSSHWASILVTALVAIVLIGWPLVNLVIKSLRVGDGWSLGNYRALASTGGRNALSVTVWEATRISLQTAFVAALIAVGIGALVAFVVSQRPKSRQGKRAISLLDAAFMLPLGVSAVTVGFGFLITLDRPLGLNIDLRSSGLLVPIAQAVVAIPLVVRTVLPVMRAIDPRQREAAATMGAPPWRVAATVDWPIAARALGLATGMAFAVSMGEFGATSFLSRPETATLPIVIFRLIGKPGAENYGMALAASVILAVLTSAIMLLAERLRGNTSGEF